MIILLLVTGLLTFLKISGSAHARSDKNYLKMASLAPKNVGWARNIRNILHPALDRVTNKKLKLKWYWSGIMGDDEDNIAKMKAGELDGAALTPIGLTMACPAMAVLQLPFLFNNYDEVDYIRNKMWQKFDDNATKNGFKILIWADQDFDQIYSVKYKMNQWSDFQQAKIVLCNGIVEEKTFAAIGMSTMPLSVSEIFSAIKQDMFDTYMGPAIWVVGSQLYPIFKYVNPIHMRYSPAAAVITLDVWNSLPQSYRTGLADIRKHDSIAFYRQCRIDSQKAFQAMEKYGMQVTTTEPATIRILKQKCLPLRKQFVGSFYSQAILSELLEHLSVFRSKETE
jgi:TRAP-type C4-dicarboxylate transport system substrate-binding protein